SGSNASSNSSVTNITSPPTLTDHRAAYALATNSSTAGPFNLTVGAGSGPATLIMILGSSIATSALTFDGTDAVIYVQRTSGIGAQTPLTINSPVSITGGGGLTKIGPGFVQLNAAASYGGSTR